MPYVLTLVSRYPSSKTGKAFYLIFFESSILVQTVLFIFIFYFVIIRIYLYYHIFVDTSLKSLQLPLNVSRLIMNGQQLSSIGFKSIKAGLSIHGSLFNDINSVAKDPLKLNNAINT